eukprot:CAMPEP_0170595868 /NCGR_PEP_ID=MMETSP0224-20130122/14797_1 /TAXON_ID=285029 /ORGANISM="Togula jolla, Strain CCCM 725" /LENGTH=724 /DNA_ID=CAMNT_0010920089 /DNA_START=120 /DNA_END=2294 /DNA_ORIENTATION=+
MYGQMPPRLPQPQGHQMGPGMGMYGRQQQPQGQHQQSQSQQPQPPLGRFSQPPQVPVGRNFGGQQGGMPGNMHGGIHGSIGMQVMQGMQGMDGGMQHPGIAPGFGGNLPRGGGMGRGQGAQQSRGFGGGGGGGNTVGGGRNNSGAGVPGGMQNRGGDRGGGQGYGAGLGPRSQVPDPGQFNIVGPNGVATWTYGQGKGDGNRMAARGGGAGKGGSGGKGAGQKGGGEGNDGVNAHSNVFVGNLPEDMTQENLERFFSPHGDVKSCVVMSKAGRTFGFVKFGSVAAATRAANALNGQGGLVVKFADHDMGSAGGPGEGKGGQGGGKGWMGDGGKGGGKGAWAGGKGWPPVLGWVWHPSNRPGDSDQRPEPDPCDNLYVRDLPPGVTEEELHATFSKFGLVVESRVLRWQNMAECAALVRMATVEQATAAREALNDTVHESCNQTLALSYQVKNNQKLMDHVYVKGLHCTSMREQLQELFSKYGTVKWCSILPLPFPPNPTSLPDCAALVQMSTEEEAAAAIQALDGTVSSGLGQPMTVRYAETKSSVDRPEVKPNSNLYVKGWPIGFPDFLLQSAFQQYGNVVRIRLLENPDPEQPTCAALVQMSRVEEATKAIKALHGQTLSLPLPPMRVKYAGRDQVASDNLYVSALPRTITEGQLRESFAKYGEIVRLRLLTQRGAAETHALVQLSDPMLAAEAIRDLDGTVPQFKGPLLNVTYAARREGMR